jgi:hypothetical protein
MSAPVRFLAFQYMSSQTRGLGLGELWLILPKKGSGYSKWLGKGDSNLLHPDLVLKLQALLHKFNEFIN